MHCETLVLRNDGTFVLTLDGDLFNNQQSSGRWSREGDYVELTSDENPFRNPMEERVTGRSGDIEIILTDENGDAWVDGTVGASTPPLWIETQPDGLGRAVLSIQSPEKIFVDGFYTGHCEYVPSSRESDTFIIHLIPTDMPPLRARRYRVTEKGLVQVKSWELERVGHRAMRMSKRTIIESRGELQP
jgi:hypothetical protein